MVSQAKGLMYIPVWVDDGVVKPLVLDTGALPVTESAPLTELDVTLKASDITLPVSEQTPLTFIQARLLTYYGATWQAPAIEADGSLHVHLNSQEADLGIAQATPALLQPGVNTYVANAWQKQPMMFGFTDTYSETDDNNYTATGFITRSLTAVPAGYVYMVTAITAIFTTGTCPAIYTYLTMGAGDIMVKSDIAAAVGVPMSISGQFPLKAGQYVKVGFNITAQPCHVYVYVSGYKMKIDM